MVTKKKLHLGIKLGPGKWVKACDYNGKKFHNLDGEIIDTDVQAINCVRCLDLIEMAYDL